MLYEPVSDVQTAEEAGMEGEAATTADAGATADGSAVAKAASPESTSPVVSFPTISVVAVSRQPLTYSDPAFFQKLRGGIPLPLPGFEGRVRADRWLAQPFYREAVVRDFLLTTGLAGHSLRHHSPFFPGARCTHSGFYW